MATDRNVTRRLSIFINDKEVVNSLSGIGRAITHTNREIRNLDATSETFDEDLARLTARSERLTEAQADLRREIHGTGEEMGAAAGAFSNLLTGLRSGNLTLAAAGFGAIKTAIVATTRAALAFIATPIGATITVLAGIAAATKEWFDFNTEAAKSNQIFAAITKQSGIALDNVRINSQALAETFNKDAEEIAGAAAALVSEFGITYDEAFKRIEDGFVKGGYAGEEFLESLREYPTFFAQAGYSVEEFQNLLNTGADLSIYQDKLPDAIKEFALSVNEATPAVREALQNAFGVDFTNNLLSGVKDGSISVKDALVQISEEAKRLGINSQQAAQLTADLFRGAGEDAGGAVKIFDAVTQSIENAKRPLSEVEQGMKDLAQSERDLKIVQDDALNSEGFARWKNTLLGIFNDVKRGWYSTISAITTTDEEREAQFKRRQQAEWGQDAIKQMEFYLDRRKKRLGDQYDYETEKEGYLKSIREQAARIALEGNDFGAAGRFAVELKALEQHKQKVAGTNNKYSQDEINAQKAKQKQLEADQKKHHEELEREKKRLQDAWNKAEQEITDLLKKSVDQRTLDGLTGLQKDIKNIELKYAAEIEKYKDHTKRVAELEAARDAEIEAAKQQRIKDYAKQRQEIEAQTELEKKAYAIEKQVADDATEAERQAAAAEAAKLIADTQLNNEMLAELAKVENVENAEALKDAIREKYRFKQQKADDAFAKNKLDKDKKTAELERLAQIKKSEDTLNELGRIVDATVAIFGQSKAAASATAVINGGLAVTEILKTPSVLPEPAASISRGIQIAGAIVTTARSIAQINSAKAPQSVKFFNGGWTGSDTLYPDEYGGVAKVSEYHPDEWVGPAYMTRQPRYAAVFEWLENERRGKRSTMPVPDGSAGAGTTAPGAQDNDAGVTNMLLQALLNRLDNPVAPNLVVGYKEVEKLNKLNEEMAAASNNGKLNT